MKLSNTIKTVITIFLTINLTQTMTLISNNLWKFNFGSYMIPHPDKKDKGGEDAFYADEHVLSVADGVGGWVEVGVDPANYSRKLCTK